MKNGRRIVALVTVLTLVLGTLGCAGADEITSGGFRLPGVKPRPTATPEVTAEPEATPVPVVTEAPTVEPQPTEAPASPVTEPETPAVTSAPTAEAVAPEATKAPDAKPVAKPTEEPASDPLEGLRQIVVVLPARENEVPLKAEADEKAESLAMIPAGVMLYVKDIDAQWSYAVYGELEGYVPTGKIALYNAEVTPEEEAVVRTISVSSSIDGRLVVNEGETVVLSAVLTGFDDAAYEMQWQYTPDGGETVCDVEGANDLAYAYTITRENASWLYRLSITVLAPAAK